MNQQLSKNYKLSEFTKSDTAAKNNHIQVVPERLIPNIKALVNNVLQPINDYTRWRNFISSGYRDLLVNKLVGGSQTSQHLKGEASDNNFYEVDENGKLVRWITPIEVARVVIELNLPIDQMILYNNFVHLSHTTSKENRKQKLYNVLYTGERL